MNLNFDIRYDFQKIFAKATWQVAAFFDQSFGREFHNTIPNIENFDYNMSSVGLAASATWSKVTLQSSVGYQLRKSDEQQRFGHCPHCNDQQYHGHNALC